MEIHCGKCIIIKAGPLITHLCLIKIQTLHGCNSLTPRLKSPQGNWKLLTAKWRYNLIYQWNGSSPLSINMTELCDARTHSLSVITPSLPAHSSLSICTSHLPPTGEFLCIFNGKWLINHNNNKTSEAIQTLYFFAIECFRAISF